MEDISPLIQAIIERSREQFDHLLSSATFDLNTVDQYGFTALIESAIVNDVYFTERLLQQGADPNKSDATGRTALHWACDNNNFKMAQLLLSHRAKPNLPMASGQTPLVFPLLRAQEKLKNILYRQGADLKFAQNFINIKLLGHRFELQGQVHIANQERELILIDFEGFFLEFSIAVIHDSLKRFRSHFSARHLSAFFPKLRMLIKCVRSGEALIRYQHYLLNTSEHQSSIMKFISDDPLFLPVTYRGHAIAFIKYGDLLMKCDRGANAKREGTVVIYRMTYPKQFSREFIFFLIYQQHTENFIHYEINELLGLKKIDSLPISAQVTGNCSWANIEGCIAGMMYLLLINDRRQVYPPHIAKQLALEFYHEWREWDKDISLDFLINEFKAADKINQASFASVVGAIFFQTCRFEDNASILRAEKMLPIIKRTEFRYIYRAYLNAYFVDNPKMEQHLTHLLDMLEERRRF